MAKKMRVGGMIATLGLLTALVIGILEATKLIDVSAYGTMVSIILVLAGIVIGALNISKSESVPFMVAAVVMGIGTAALAVLPFVGTAMQGVFARLATLVVPAAIVVAGKVAYKKMM